MTLPLGTILLGRYITGRVLGKGGFGVTYLAYDSKEDKRVAVKEFLPDALTHRNTGDTVVSTYQGEKEEAFKKGAERFYEEARTVSRFNGHPTIVAVQEFFYENDTAYYVMEYLEGMDLKHYIAQNGGRLGEQRTLEILRPLVDALIVVHSVGILHRDISPDNVYITTDGSTKLLDFGAARQVMGEASKSLSVVLKQGFAPLEQYQSRGKQGPWTDVYALGATAYYCLAGHVPLSAMDRMSTPGLDVPCSDYLRQVLEKAMAIQARQRYQTMAELKAALFPDSVVTLKEAAPEIPGIPGAPGIPSVAPGAARVPGAPGVPGVAGMAGMAGAGGVAGVTGTAGVPGAAGMLGVAGSPGAAGAPWAYAVAPPPGAAAAHAPLPLAGKLSGMKSHRLVIIAAAASAAVVILAVVLILALVPRGHSVVGGGGGGSVVTTSPTSVLTTASSATPTVAPSTAAPTGTQTQVADWDYTWTDPFSGEVHTCPYTGTVVSDATGRSLPNDPNATFTCDNGFAYVGGWVAGVMSGRGTITYAPGDPGGRVSFSGDISGDKGNGWGTMVWTIGEYTGEIKDGSMNGQGTLTFNDSDKTVVVDSYVGEFKDGNYDGLGTITFKSGEKYFGDFKNGVIDGFGTWTWTDDSYYVGDFKDNTMNGYGTSYLADGTVVHQGQWKNGEFIG